MVVGRHCRTHRVKEAAAVGRHLLHMQSEGLQHPVVLITGEVSLHPLLVAAIAGISTVVDHGYAVRAESYVLAGCKESAPASFEAAAFNMDILHSSVELQFEKLIARQLISIVVPGIIGLVKHFLCCFDRVFCEVAFAFLARGIFGSLLELVHRILFLSLAALRHRLEEES